MSFPGLNNPFAVMEERQEQAILGRLERDDAGRPLSWAMIAQRMGVSRPVAFKLAAKGWRRLKRYGYATPELRALLFPRRPESSDDVPRRRRRYREPTPSLN